MLSLLYVCLSPKEDLVIMVMVSNWEWQLCINPWHPWSFWEDHLHGDSFYLKNGPSDHTTQRLFWIKCIKKQRWQQVDSWDTCLRFQTGILPGWKIVKEFKQINTYTWKSHSFWCHCLPFAVRSGETKTTSSHNFLPDGSFNCRLAEPVLKLSDRSSRVSGGFGGLKLLWVTLTLNHSWAKQHE